MKVLLFHSSRDAEQTTLMDFIEEQSDSFDNACSTAFIFYDGEFLCLQRCKDGRFWVPVDPESKAPRISVHKSL